MISVITFESTILSTPFENNVEVFDLRGDHILDMLEYSVANDPYAGARNLQVSGTVNLLSDNVLSDIRLRIFLYCMLQSKWW